MRVVYADVERVGRFEQWAQRAHDGRQTDRLVESGWDGMWLRAAGASVYGCLRVEIAACSLGVWKRERHAMQPWLVRGVVYRASPLRRQRIDWTI